MTLGAASLPGPVSSEHHPQLGPHSNDISDRDLLAFSSPPLNVCAPTTSNKKLPQPQQTMSAKSEMLSASEIVVPEVDTSLPSWSSQSSGDHGYFRASHAVYSSHSPSSSKLGSISSTDSAESEIPLSMRFMYKPLRSGDQLRKASDPTRRNSLMNAHIDELSTASPPRDALESPSHLRSFSMDAAPYRLVRKKSGEIVKSLLKDNISKHRSKSLPSTPIFKLVHFGDDADVRYFSKKDRPTAILALNSPSLDTQSNGEDDDDMSGDDEDYLSRAQAMIDYYDDELNSHADSSYAPQKASGITKYPSPHHGRLIDWDVNVINLPSSLVHDRIVSIHPPVFLERVFVSPDKKFLLGHIAVNNIAFEKSVTVRYTLDNWATIVEIPTIYVPDIPTTLRNHNYDRFMFKIPLDSMFNSFHLSDEGAFLFSRQHEKMYHMCIRYCLPGHEFWDNNGGKDYLIKLKKTIRSMDQLAGPGTKNGLVNERATPRLQGGVMELPKTARSKPEEHSQRPKYSSHYMKRFHSEPNLKNVNLDITKGLDSSTNSAAENNQMGKDNMYFTSPRNSNIGGIRGNGVNNLDPLSEEPTLDSSQTSRGMSSSNTEALSETVLPPPDLAPNPPTKNTIEKDKNLSNFNNLLDSKSYRELLDSYCFFTSPSRSCPTNASASEDNSPTDTTDAPPVRVPDTDGTFTVSSILRS